MKNDQKPAYDLEERTTVLGVAIVKFCKRVPQDVVTRPLIDQIVRSGTSIGANYREANGASSRKDFTNKIHICKKEAKETLHWFAVLSPCLATDLATIATELIDECQQLVLIFGKIASSSKVPLLGILN